MMSKETVQVDVIETTIYNEKPELKKLECIGCGGNLEIMDKTHAVCPHCGRNYRIDEAGKVKIDVNVDYTARDQVQSSAMTLMIVLGAVLAVAVLAAVGIIAYNISIRGF